MERICWFYRSVGRGAGEELPKCRIEKNNPTATEMPKKNRKIIKHTAAEVPHK